LIAVDPYVGATLVNDPNIADIVTSNPDAAKAIYETQLADQYADPTDPSFAALIDANPDAAQILTDNPALYSVIATNP